MDAVGRTFKMLWRCRDGFKIQNLDDHKALFVFDNIRDVKWILLSEPWSFDKHVIFKIYLLRVVTLENGEKSWYSNTNACQTSVIDVVD